MIQSPELADAARGCRASRHAAALAEWVGPSRQVTDKRVLRRADVAAACAAVGVTYDESDPADALEIGRLMLTVLATASPPGGTELFSAFGDVLFATDHALWEIFSRGFGIRDPVDVVMQPS